VAELEATLARQQAQLDALTARLNQHSGNSSQPPSADPPQARDQRRRPPPSGRPRGGQPGHKGTTRCAFPPEWVVATHDCFPNHCPDCHLPLPPSPAPAAPPQVHQVADLPPLQWQVQEYRLHARTCPRCRRRCRAALPPGVPQSQWGPGAQALAALLVGYFRLSRRQTVEYFATLFGLAPSLGTVSALETATTAALRPLVQEVDRAVQRADAVHADETGWRQARDRPTLWVVVAGSAARFRIGRRTGEMFAQLLPPGRDRVVISDRYAVYERVEATWRQLCWAHLQRNFQALVDLGSPTGSTVGTWALGEIRQLFHAWHQFREGSLDRAGLRRALQPVQAAFRALLALGSAGPCPRTRTLCGELETWWEALWTFAREAGVEPTNNAAERALRPAVLWRKSSFGHQSEAGQQFVESLLTVGGTLRLQGRPVLPVLRAACEAALTREPAPRLLLGAAPSA
jgi:transposase